MIVRRRYTMRMCCLALSFASDVHVYDACHFVCFFLATCVMEPNAMGWDGVWLLQLANIYITVATGSITTALKAILEDFEAVSFFHVFFVAFFSLFFADIFCRVGRCFSHLWSSSQSCQGCRERSLYEQYGKLYLFCDCGGKSHPNRRAYSIDYRWTIIALIPARLIIFYGPFFVFLSYPPKNVIIVQGKGYTVYNTAMAHSFTYCPTSLSPEKSDRKHMQYQTHHTLFGRVFFAYLCLWPRVRKIIRKVHGILYPRSSRYRRSCVTLSMM